MYIVFQSLQFFISNSIAVSGTHKLTTKCGNQGMTSYNIACNFLSLIPLEISQVGSQRATFDECALPIRFKTLL
jgi:hypothetical protein